LANEADLVDLSIFSTISGSLGIGIKGLAECQIMSRAFLDITFQNCHG
jgi:hypothetical protein